MTLPLYENNKAPQNYRAKFNTGLWHDKYYQAQGSKKHWDLQEDQNKIKAEWIKKLTQENSEKRSIGFKELISFYSRRQAKFVQVIGGKVRCFTTQSRFVTGLGREHPIENGMTWHHILGVPFMPGSSVKGIVRNWAKVWDGASNSDIVRIFGPRGDSKEEEDLKRSVGSVIFFDALPINSLKLSGDVMTPHYSQYYQQKESVPGDWFDPVPIPFLVVEKEQDFIFSLAPRDTMSKQSQADFEQSLNWLENALKEIGGGAKVSAGYGRFKRKEMLEKEFIVS